MAFLRGFPIAAILLISVAPYTAWGFFGASYPEWHAHRAALVGCCVVLLCLFALRGLGLSPQKAVVVVALPVLGALATVLNPIVLLVTVAAALVAAIIDRHRAYENANLALIIVGAALFFGAAKPVVQVSTFNREVVATAAGTSAIGMDGEIVLRQTPSIIQIVLDGYGSTQTLNSIYDHDTQPFFEQLEARGFVVIENAVSPYSQTLPTMASVMSGAPVDMSRGAGDPTMLRLNLGHTVRNGPVPSLLEAAGYTFARAESGYDFLDFDNAEVVAAEGLTRMSLLDAYLLRTFGSFFGPVHNRTLMAALSPGTLGDLPQPFFYYQHLIGPHPPFTIAADGSFRETDDVSFNDGMARASEEQRAAYITGYREKAQFIETSLIEQIDALPDGPMIVIIHGDHGPGAFHHYNAAEETCMSERLGTFVAIYSDIPEVTAHVSATPEDGFSIVNIYRAVFAGLSGADIPLLEPQANFLPWNDPTSVVPVSPAEFAGTCMPGPT